MSERSSIEKLKFWVSGTCLHGLFAFILVYTPSVSFRITACLLWAGCLVLMWMWRPGRRIPIEKLPQDLQWILVDHGEDKTPLLHAARRRGWTTNAELDLLLEESRATHL